MGEKPTLHEIAAMPFPQSEQELLRHYGVDPYREGGGQKSWKVCIEYCYTMSDEDDFEIEAENEQEARELAREECAQLCGGRDNFEILDVTVLARPA